MISEVMVGLLPGPEYVIFICVAGRIRIKDLERPKGFPIPVNNNVWFHRIGGTFASVQCYGATT